MWKVCDNQILMSNVQIMDLYHKGCYLRLKNNVNGKYQLMSFKLPSQDVNCIVLYIFTVSLTSKYIRGWSHPVTTNQNACKWPELLTEPLSPGLVPVSGVVMTWKSQESRQGWQVTTRNTITHSYDEITTISTRLVAIKLMIHQILQRVVI